MDSVNYRQRDRKVTNIKAWLGEMEDGWKVSYIHISGILEEENGGNGREIVLESIISGNFLKLKEGMHF